MRGPAVKAVTGEPKANLSTTDFQDLSHVNDHIHINVHDRLRHRKQGRPCIHSISRCVIFSNGLVSGVETGFSNLVMFAITMIMVALLYNLEIKRRWQCNNTLPRGGMYWKIRPPRIKRFAEAGILHPEARGQRGAKSLLRQISRSEEGVFSILFYRAGVY